MLRGLKLMCVLAHPDDESLGMGGAIARYASEGVEVTVVCATRGEMGRFGHAPEKPAPEVVGRAREAELRAAAEILGIGEVVFLDYTDRSLDAADPLEAQRKIAGHIRRIRPQVVVTFAPDGAYGHPDHIAISQFATGAVLASSDPDFEACDGAYAPHRVSKLYYIAWSGAKWEAYQEALKRLVCVVDGSERQAAPWPEWAVTTVIDTAAFWPVAWRAVQCHKTQVAIFSKLEHMSEAGHRGLWGTQEFYRAMSLVNGGRRRETDLFEGLREEAA